MDGQEKSIRKMDLLLTTHYASHIHHIHLVSPVALSVTRLEDGASICVQEGRDSFGEHQAVPGHKAPAPIMCSLSLGTPTSWFPYFQFPC